MSAMPDATTTATPSPSPSHLPNHFDNSPYHYTPTLYVCVIFIVLFSLSGLIHTVQAIRTRLWFMLPTASLANLTEVIGWAGRLWSNKNILLLDPYLMQITTTIIAPTPLVAANFVILGQLIARLGSKYSRLSATWYTIVFVSCDIVSLVIQSIGGATASQAVHKDKSPDSGGHIMLGGIVFQLVAITVYVALAAEFIMRYLSDRPLRGSRDKTGGPRYLDRNMKLMLLGLSFSSLTIFIRSIYRTIELSNGWNGRIIGTQVYFNVLDGMMITLATFVLNFLHPGSLLGPGPWPTEETWENKRAHSPSLNTYTEEGARTPGQEKMNAAEP